MRRRIRVQAPGNHENERHPQHQRQEVPNRHEGPRGLGRIGQRNLRTRRENAPQAKRRSHRGQADAQVRQCGRKQKNNNGLGRRAQVPRLPLHSPVPGLFHHRIGCLDMHGTDGDVSGKVAEENQDAHTRRVSGKSHRCSECPVLVFFPKKQT